MNANNQALIAYLSTLGAIVLLTIAAAAIVMLANFDSEQTLAKVIAALAFISAAVTGLIGVIGTFRPKGPPSATTQSGDVNMNEGIEA